MFCNKTSLILWPMNSNKDKEKTVRWKSSFQTLLLPWLNRETQEMKKGKEQRTQNRKKVEESSQHCLPGSQSSGGLSQHEVMKSSSLESGKAFHESPLPGPHHKWVSLGLL